MSLRNARSYTDARDAAELFEQMGKLSPQLLDALEDAYLNNSQLYPYHVGTEVLERIFKSHSRVLPIPEETLIRLRRL